MNPLPNFLLVAMFLSLRVLYLNDLNKLKEKKFQFQAGGMGNMGIGKLGRLDT
jgi:hypothetical protein